MIEIRQALGDKVVVPFGTTGEAVYVSGPVRIDPTYDVTAADNYLDPSVHRDMPGLFPVQVERLNERLVPVDRLWVDEGEVIDSPFAIRLYPQNRDPARADFDFTDKLHLHYMLTSAIGNRTPTTVGLMLQAYGDPGRYFNGNMSRLAVLARSVPSLLISTQQEVLRVDLLNPDGWEGDSIVCPRPVGLAIGDQWNVLLGRGAEVSSRVQVAIPVPLPRFVEVIALNNNPAWPSDMRFLSVVAEVTR